MNKKVITISIILILAIVAGGFWYASNQNNVIPEKSGIQNEQKNEKISQNNQDIEELKIEDIDTSDWKTYRNEEFGFEIKLPHYNYEKQVDSTIIFDLTNKDILGNLSISFSDTDPAWWEDPNREFPGYIEKIAEYHTDKYNIVYYRSMQIIVNPDEHIDNTPKEIITAIIDANNDKFIDIVSTTSNFDDAMSIFNTIISNLQML